MFPIPLRKVVLQLSLLIVTLAVDTHYLYQIQKVDRKVSINTLNILFFFASIPLRKKLGNYPFSSRTFDYRSVVKMI